MSSKQPLQIALAIRNSGLNKTESNNVRLSKAGLRGAKLINIGGRPVIVPNAKPKTESGRSRADSIKLGLAFAAIYLVWGSTYLAIRYAVETIPPLVTAGIRHTIAGGVLLAWACLRGYRPKREHWVAGAVIGALFFLIGHGTLHWAEQHVASGLAALLIATEPMFILVLAWASGQQKISRISALGLGLGVIGVGVLAGAELSAKDTSLLGLIAVLVGSLSWSAGVVVSPKLKLPTDALARTAVPLVCGAAMLLATAGVTGEFHQLHWANVSLKSLLGLAYLITFGSIVAFTAYTWLLQRCPPTLVATHTYANPIVAVLLGWMFASEPLTMRVVIASIAILGAIVLIRRGERGTKRRGVAATSSSAASSKQDSVEQCA
jgi:drug/metabolite transporter (DMT)-like permease